MNINSLRFVSFYNRFKFGIQSVAQDDFKKRGGSLSRINNKKKANDWVNTICSNYHF